MGHFKKKTMLIIGFEPRCSGVSTNRSANSAITTAALFAPSFVVLIELALSQVCCRQNVTVNVVWPQS